MFEYTRGGDEDGFALVTEHVVVLIDRTAGEEFVADLYHGLHADRGGLDAALDAIGEAGVDAAVAVVEVREAQDRSIRVAVRGEYTVEMGGGGSTRLGGPSRPDWTMTEASGVRRFTLRAATDPSPRPAAARRLPLRSGVVRASRIDFSIEDAPRAARPIAVDDAATRPVPIIARGAHPVAAAAPRRVSLAFPAGLEDTAAPRGDAGARTPEAAHEHAAGAQPPAEAPGPRRGRSAAPEAQAGPAPETQAGSAPETPAAPGPHAQAAEAGSGWMLRLPDGGTLDPRAPIVFGRRPWHRRGRVDEAVHVVVPSPRREISGEHLEVSVVDGVVTARDLGSTNGTLLFSGDLPPQLVHEGHRVPLRHGDILDMGEGFCITVAEPGGTAGDGGTVASSPT